MTPQLPRRPFRSLAPPPDGLDVVRREARRRRRRRATVVAAGGTGVAAVVIAVLLSTASGGLAVLKPTPDAPAGGSRVTTPHPSTSAHGGRHTLPPLKTPFPSTHVAHHAPRQNHEAPAPTPDEQSSSASRTQSSDQRTAPTLTRYRSTYAGGVANPRLCSGVESTDDNGTHHGVDWCPAAKVGRVSGGERLTFQICRDSTSGGQLTFADSREVNLVLRHNSHVVWSWARVAPGQPDSHTLSARADGCWNWTLVWPGVTAAGRTAPRGSYTLTASSTVQEVSPQLAKASFRY